MRNYYNNTYKNTILVRTNIERTMDRKLTLKLDQKVIDRAKVYADKNNTSISKLVEHYLMLLTEGTPLDTIEITPLVKSLSGIIDSKNIPDYKKHVLKKYGK